MMIALGVKIAVLNWSMSVKFKRTSVMALWLLAGSQGVFAVQIDDINASGNPRGDADQRNNVVVSPLSTVPSANEPVGGTPQAATDGSNRVESASGGSSALIEMARRQQELQAQVEQLRSTNEELNHAVENLEARLRDMYKDLDRRIQEVEKKAVAAAAATDASGGLDASAPVASPGDAAAESKAYEHAFNLLREKKYDQSIEGFQRFLKTYPNSEFADNARYWIAESYYVKGDFKQAAANFKTLINNHPSSSKLADAYLKLGFAQYELGQDKDAHQSLNVVVKQYGKSTAARMAKERLDRMSKEGR